MDSDSVCLALSHSSASECYSDEQDPPRSDSNNNRGVCISPSTVTEDLYSPSSSSSSGRDSQLSPDNYLDEEFYGKLKVKVRKDGKKLIEKKRRQDLQQQYSNLRMMVPGLLDVEGRTPFSRNVILKHTLNYIEQLKVCVSSSFHLPNELQLEQEYNHRLEEELQMWQKKVADLREKKRKPVRNMTSLHGQSKNQSRSLQTIT